MYEPIAQTLDPETAKSSRPDTTSNLSRTLEGDKSAGQRRREPSQGPDIDENGNLVVKGVRLRKAWVLVGIIAGSLLAIAIFTRILTDLYRLINDDGETPVFPQGPRPIPCHSHNDYWRERPVFSALETGCMGIEADVWLRDDRLWVAHTWEELPGPESLDLTFGRLYVGRLMRVLEKQNHYNATRGAWTSRGVYDSAPEQTVVLLIDIKGEPEAMWPVVMRELQPLRERGWLSVVDHGSVRYGPITIVGTGNTDFDLLMQNSTHRDVFFDAPLAGLEGAKFDTTNSYYASASFGQELGLSLLGFLIPSQAEKVRQQVKAAHDRGLKVRYWNEPRWLPWVNRRGWSELADLGVDFLNVDYLYRFRQWWMKRQRHQTHPN